MSAGRARAQVLAAAVLFSTGGVAVKTAAFSAAQISSFRAAIAAATLWLWLGGGVTWSRGVWMAGVPYAAMTILYVMSTRLTTSASAIFLQSTGPLYLLLLGPYLLKEHPRRSDLVYFGALVIGLALCFARRLPATTTAPDPATGNLLALLGGFAWALTLIALRRVERSAAVPGAAVAAVIAGCLLASVVMLPFALPLRSAPIDAWLVLIFLGVFQIGLAYRLVTSAVRYLPAFEMSLLLLLEPVLNPLWTWLVWKEYPGGFALAGGAVIVTATAIKSVFDARTTKSSTRPR